MSNLFSSFDPMVSFFFFSMSINWVSVFICILMFPQSFWLCKSQMIKSFEIMILYLYDEMEAVFGTLCMPGSIFFFIQFFFFILFSNFMGLFPYVFTSTSHMSLTLTLALPIWLGSMVWSMYFQYNNIMAHLVPTGTPGVLMPVMVMIESVSNLIRPGTLSIRLAANMVAGHLLLTLLGSQAIGLDIFILVGLMVSLILLLILEMAVACIQSYVFTILSSLYLSELSNTGFSKYMVLNKV